MRAALLWCGVLSVCVSASASPAMGTRRHGRRLVAAPVDAQRRDSFTEAQHTDLHTVRRDRDHAWNSALALDAASSQQRTAPAAQPATPELGGVELLEGADWGPGERDFERGGIENDGRALDEGVAPAPSLPVVHKSSTHGGAQSHGTAHQGHSARRGRSRPSLATEGSRGREQLKMDMDQAASELEEATQTAQEAQAAVTHMISLAEQTLATAQLKQQETSLQEQETRANLQKEELRLKLMVRESEDIQQELQENKVSAKEYDEQIRRRKSELKTLEVLKFDLRLRYERAHELMSQVHAERKAAEKARQEAIQLKKEAQLAQEKANNVIAMAQQMKADADQILKDAQASKMKMLEDRGCFV